MGIIQKFRRTVNEGRAMDHIRGAGDWLQSAKQAVQGWGGRIRTIADNGSTFIGMTADAVDTVCGAIDTYVSDIEAVAETLVTDANPQLFIHGAAADEVIPYLEAAKELLLDYVSNYKAFKEKMVGHYTDMKANDQTLSSSFSGEAAELKAAAERYQDTSGK